MRVLLIDGDLRRPGFSARRAGEPDPGLADVLRGEIPLMEAARRAGPRTSGSFRPPTTPRRATSWRGGSADVLDEARENFDLVIIDTPPLLSTDDARTIATSAKGILLVVTRGTLARSVNEAVVAIEALQAPLMGVVANRFKESSVPYYY